MKSAEASVREDGGRRGASFQIWKNQRSARSIGEAGYELLNLESQGSMQSEHVLLRASDIQFGELGMTSQRSNFKLENCLFKCSDIQIQSVEIRDRPLRGLNF